MDDSGNENEQSRLFVFEEQRRKSPSPHPRQKCTIETSENNGDIKIIRLFYTTETFFKGRKSANNKYLISQMQTEYINELGVHNNEWIIIDINNNHFDTANNYEFENIQKHLHYCNTNYCYPQRSTGFILKLQRIQNPPS